MHRQHFSHAGVVVEDQVARIAPRIEVAHARLRTPNKRSIAEDDPGFHRTGEKSTPERPKCSRSRVDIGAASCLRFTPRFNQDNDNRQRRCQKHREHNRCPSHPRRGHGFGSDLMKRGMCTMMERENVGPLRHFHDDRIVRTIRAVVLSQLHAQASCLHADGRIRLRVEIRRSSKDFRSDLIFLQGDARMMECMVGEITKQLAERFRPMKDTTADQAIDLSEKLLPLGYRGAMIACHTHLTRE